MNYEFHVGDYVKTRAGFIGYIDNISDLENDNIAVRVCFSDGDTALFRVNDLNITNNFLRIGAYDFTKKEKKKIENLTINKTMFQYTGDGTANTGADYTAVYENTKFQDKVIDKINELVDAVNELRSDYDEHIEAHRQTDR